MYKIRREFFCLPLWLLLTLTGACSSGINLQVDGQLPTPVSSQLPLSMGVHYNDNFRNNIFKENTEARQNWTIDYRVTRQQLFDQILPSMFRTVTLVEEPDAPPTDPVLDAILEPDVLETQVALPQETHSDMYEAWVKYGMKLYLPDGQLISDWQITGYGKAPTSMFTSRQDGLNNAITIALRDLGAKLVLEFRNAPGVRDWLSGKINCAEYPHLC